MPHVGEEVASVHVWILPLHVDRLSDLPEHDSDAEHALARDQMLIVDRRLFGMPVR